MNRRKLLKTAGVATLTAPFVTAGLYWQRSKAQAVGAKPLVIVFSGPFVFWMNVGGNPNVIRAVAPPVGHTDPEAPHWPWIGTTGNEISLDGISNTALKLAMSFTPGAQTVTAGLDILPCPRPNPTPISLTSFPLFTLDIPAPDVIVGTNPTYICLGTCLADGSNQMKYAAGAIFIYKNVDLGSVNLPVDSNLYTPDFNIDIDVLPSATLGVYLTPCDCPTDWCHTHARAVISKMQGMYPWISEIDFFPPVGACPNIAHGDDCQAPIIRV